MTIRDIAVAFGFEVDKNSEKSAENSIKGIKNLATKLLGAIGIGFSITGIGNLAEAAAEVEALKSQFSQVFGDVEDEASAKLNAISENTGVMANRMKGSFVQIAAFAKTTGMESADALALSERALKTVADAAAFYDRSMEDVTNSLQSFLKGNFGQDAALGLSCTEVTRNAAANSLYGKSFKDLAEDQKQLTLLKMVEDANKASGALGQAARESDIWMNQLGNLKQSLTDLKAVAGSAFLQPAVMVLKVLSTLVQGLTAKLQEATSETGFITKASERLHALVKRLQPAIDRMSQTLSKSLGKGIEVVNGIIYKLGGVENVLKIVVIALGAFMAVMAVAKVMSFVKELGGMAGVMAKLSKIFSVANLKILAIVAVIIILALIIEDFINFMMGNDSVIGTFFDKAGIGADNARQAIFNEFNKVKTFLAKTWQEIKAVVEKHGGSIGKSVKKIFGGILTIAGAIFKTLLLVATKAFEGLGGIFGEIDLSTPINAIVSTIDVLLGVLGTLGEFISEHAGLVDVLVKAYGAFKLGSVVLQLTKLTKAFALTTAAKIKDAAETVYLKALYAKDFVFGIKNTVIALASQAKAFATSLAAKVADKAETIALQAMYAKDFVASLVSSTAALVKQAAQFALNTAAKVADTVAQGAMTAATLAWNVAATVATTVTSALGAAMAFLTSPIGLVVLAIAALIAIGVLLYKNWDTIKEFASSLWKNVTSAFQTGIENVKAFMSGVIEFVQNNWQALLLLIVNPFAGAFKLLYDNCEGFRNFINQFLENIKAVWKSAWGVISSFFQVIWDNISSFVSSTFGNMLSGVTGFVANIKDAIVNGLTAAIDWIKQLPSQALQWGSDIIDGIVNGIKGAVGKVTDAVKGVAGKIKSFLHFSVPDEGPLTDYQSWMPDFMQGLGEGIKNNESFLMDKVRGVASGIATIMKGATANVSTAAASTINNTTSSMTQNVNINNSYTGGSAETQKNVSKAMRKSAVDATTQMARGLAYARG